MPRGIGRVVLVTALGIGVTAGTAAAQSVIVTPPANPPGPVIVQPGPGQQPIVLQPGQSVTISVLPGGEVRTSYDAAPHDRGRPAELQHFLYEQIPPGR